MARPTAIERSPARGRVWLAPHGAWRRALLILLAAGQLLVLVAPIRQPPIIYDEGIVATGAARVLNGAVPYRDFWTAYAPGQFYALAAIFKLFGSSLLVARLADTAVRVALALLVFLIAARLTSPRVAWIPWLVVTVWLAADSNYGYAMFPALTLMLLAVYLLLIFIVSMRRGLLVAAGGAVGFATIFRQDVGLYAGAAGLLTLIAVTVGDRSDRLLPVRGTVRAVLRATLPFVVSAAVPVLAVLVLLLRVLPAGTVWHDLIVFPITTLQDERARPLPPLFLDPRPVLRGDASLYSYLWGFSFSWIRFYLPLLIYAIAGLVMLWTWRRTRFCGAGRAQGWGLLLITLSGLFLFNNALHRFDNIHVFPTDVLAVILLTILIAHGLPHSRRPVARTLLAGSLLCVAISYLYIPLTWYWGLVQAGPPLACHASLPRAGCAAVLGGQEQAVAYIQEHTASDEPIYVGDRNHDRVFANDVLFYFLAARPSATRYHELHPGVITTRPVQREICNDLRTEEVQYVVLVARFDNIWEANDSAKSSGVTDLDDCIRAHYRPVEQFGSYTILQRG